MQESDFKILLTVLIKTHKEKLDKIQMLNNLHELQNWTLTWRKGGVNALNFGSIWCLASTVHLKQSTLQIMVLNVVWSIYNIQGLKRRLTEHTVVWLPYCLCIDHDHNDIRHPYIPLNHAQKWRGRPFRFLTCFTGLVSTRLCPMKYGKRIILAGIALLFTPLCVSDLKTSRFIRKHFTIINTPIFHSNIIF